MPDYRWCLCFSNSKCGTVTVLARLAPISLLATLDFKNSNSKCELCGEKFGPCPCVLTLFFTTQPVIMLN